MSPSRQSPPAFLVLRPSVATVEAFVEYWEPFYGERNLTMDRVYEYDRLIHEQPTPQSILGLFEWKNGTRLSASKRRER